MPISKKFNPFTKKLDLVSIEDLSSYIPYTGATGAVNLNAQNLSNVGTLGAGAITGTSYVGLTFTITSAIQWSGTKLQVKTIAVTNGVVGAESGWTDVATV